jgi:hypothetical protein
MDVPPAVVGAMQKTTCPAPMIRVIFEQITVIDGMYNIVQCDGFCHHLLGRMLCDPHLPRDRHRRIACSLNRIRFIPSPPPQSESPPHSTRKAHTRADQSGDLSRQSRDEGVPFF